MTQQDEMKVYRGRLSEFQKDLLLFLYERCKKMSSKQLGINARKEEIENNISSILIPYSPSLLFDAKGNEGKQYSKATRSLEQKGYLIRHKGSNNGFTSYVQLTEDGILISKTWKSYTDSMSDVSDEDDELDNFFDEDDEDDSED
jgi:DNA-binding MarR family transcriptional regulator